MSVPVSDNSEFFPSASHRSFVTTSPDRRPSTRDFGIRLRGCRIFFSSSRLHRCTIALALYYWQPFRFGNCNSHAIATTEFLDVLHDYFARHSVCFLVTVFPMRIYLYTLIFKHTSSRYFQIINIFSTIYGYVLINLK